MKVRTDEEILAHRAATKDILTESQLQLSGTANLWSPARIQKYLTKYNLGPGPTEYGRAKKRYRKQDVAKARNEMLEMEPKDAAGKYLNPTLAFLQSENAL